MRELLADTGSLYLHCDWRVNSILKCMLDEVFGAENGLSEIVWKCSSAHANTTTRYDTTHQTIFFYVKSPNYTWTQQFIPYDDEYVETYYRYKEPDGRRFKSTDLTGRANPVFDWHG